ncbi:MAG: MerR family transcriptional regulator, light-induced transcriptional regulator, partial [Pseudomonadota bacterium]|nr:MerR family transcriptional regulator, light-induced transcriptional regulator [Pseudomonadota bacterium]
MYSIKAVSQATGLTVETLRAWERRYGIVAPNRDPTGRRVYRADDVLRLRRLREATERGHPIGRLAELSEESLAQLLNEAPDRRTRATSSAFVERILEAAKEYRSAECEQALTLAIAMMPPQRLVSDVLQPLLREVGERWHRGEFAISQERLVSTIVRRHVGLMLDTYDRTARHQAIVFATLPGERHELGLLMSAMICASRGFKTHYLGP